MKSHTFVFGSSDPADTNAGAIPPSLPAATAYTGAPPPAHNITSEIAADQASIVFKGGSYVIDVSAGETLTYSGVMSGYGSLKVEGGGTLVLTGDSTFAPSPANQHETVTTAHAEENIYWGIDFGYNTSTVNVLNGQNKPVVTIEKGTTLSLGSATANTGYGNIASYIDAFGASYNVDNIRINGGTLSVNYWGGYGYGLALGEISGTGFLENQQGTVFMQGTSTFKGLVVSSSLNNGGYFADYALPDVKVIDNQFVTTFSAEVLSAGNPPFDTVSQTIYSQNYGNSVHNQGPGLLVVTGLYEYSDSGNHDAPSLSNSKIDYMTINGNSSQRQFDCGQFQQFGNGTNARFFMPGNAITASIGFFGTGENLALDYNGTVDVDAAIGGFYGPPLQGGAQNGNLIIVGTAGNHIVLTQACGINGFTDIQANAVLQLGDGTVGNGSTITVNSAQGSVTGFYSTSGGNGSLLTAESQYGAATDSITDDGALVVDDTPGAVDGITSVSLSNIAGSGSLVQEGTLLLTLLENTAYTGATTIAHGTLALGSTGNISASSLVELTHADSGFDISQAGNQTVHTLTGIAGSRIWLGGNVLTIDVAGSASLASTINDGGIGGGTGGALAVTGGGTLTLSGDTDSTGGIVIDGATLHLALSRAAGSGEIRFAAGASSTLQIDGANAPGAIIGGLASGDTINLASVAYDGTMDAVLKTTSHGYDLLQLVDGTHVDFSLKLDPASVSPGETFAVTSNGQGGTDIAVAGQGGFLNFRAGIDGTLPCFQHVNCSSFVRL